jgi:ankyrin repeat protein
MLIRKGVDIGIRDYHGGTLLHKAAFHLCGSEKVESMVELLVKEGVGLEWRDSSGETLLLFFAIRTGLEHVPKMLIRRGANIESTDSRGRTLLVVAVADGEEDAGMAQLLIRSGARMDPCPALGSAIVLGRRNITGMLLNHGADVNTRFKIGETPLIAAVRYGRAEIARHLVEKGADLRGRDSSGLSALSIAMLYGNGEWLDFLIDADADIKEADSAHGPDILAAAIYVGSEFFVQQMLSIGVEPTTVSGFGSPLVIAAACSADISIFRLLLKASSNILESRTILDSALRDAISWGNTEAAGLLRGKVRERERALDGDTDTPTI